ncbi:MAG: IS1634 family transposase [Smithellaceae bacterium]
MLCTRLEQLLSGQTSLLPVDAAIEKLAQRYAARLITSQQPVNSEDKEGIITYQPVDVDSLEMLRPRSVGVEYAGLAALSWLGIPEVLESIGMNGVQRAVAIGSIIGKMANPTSERGTWNWLKDNSAVGELLDVDFEGMPLMRLYRVSDILIRRREDIEKALYGRISNLFSLQDTVTLYDLTNTFFEGKLDGNRKAKRGKSKEKRSDCPLITLGLVLDGSGFIRRSRMFEGNVSEAGTLETMLEGLGAPPSAMVIMDRGIATKENISWLVEHQYRYLVVSREQCRQQFDESCAVETTNASQEKIKIQRVLNEAGDEVRLYCHSHQRQEKEVAIAELFTKRFETGLTKLAASLTKPRGEKKRDKIQERIGRLKEKSHGIAWHYRIDMVLDESKEKVIALTWEKISVEGTQLTHPGIYCLRTNELNWDEATLWHTYTLLTDLEAVFRSLKSELGLRPVFHSKEERAEGHLFITVLAYQAVQVLRRRLKEHGINLSWSSLRNIFSVQQRITATFKQQDGRTLHIRKATIAETNLKNLYDALGISASPGGIQKLVI